MDASDLSQHQLDGFSVVERVASVLSLLGCIVIIGTFCASRAFHKPINRLVFYASFGNLMTNVATLMARTYLGNVRSAGCQLQAFLIQMCMPADAFWTLAMAINVYLTFYCKYDARDLRRMELLYLACCYGIPLVVALVFVFIQTPAQGRMYGNATLWCWVSPEWDVFRIAAFYGPVWVAILVTFFIYIRAGSAIYQKHRQLRDFKYSSGRHESDREPDREPELDAHGASKTTRKTTHVVVTTEITAHCSGHGDAIDLAPLGRRDPSTAASEAGKDSSAAAVCSVTISADKSTPATPAGGPRNPASQRMRRRAAYEAGSAAWSYAKCALLFFTAMLVTWIPSSANRVFSVVHGGQVALPLEYMSAFVLPLQGFWNAIVYAVTSWKACCTLWDERIIILGGAASAPGKSKSVSESESVVELTIRS